MRRGDAGHENGNDVDYLTGLLSRRQFQARAEVRMKNEPPGLVLVWFDIDNFKLYNRRFGFNSGSELLRELAALLASAFQGTPPREDLVSRFSDDHFVVLTTWEGLEEKIDRVQRDLYRGHKRMALKLRAGIYLPSEGDEASAACDRAKMASDSIRKNHSVSTRIYQEDLSKDLAQSKYIVDVLDDAIARGDITVHYQPIVRVLTGRICETEALTRWNDPCHGCLSPSDFVPTLEQYRDVHKLDLCAVRQVCADLRARSLRGQPILPTSINLSRLDFELCDIFQEVERIVEGNGVPKNMLKIEITESVHGEDPGMLHLGIEKFRQNGYEVWMDDFGSGYSSLNVLKDYTFDTIKFDMKFLSDFGKSEKSRYILSSNLSMAKQMGAQSLAEGVETGEQLEYLRSIGFEKAQGYLFGRPMSLDEIFALPLPKEDVRDAPYYERLGRVELPNQELMNHMGHVIADVRAMALLERSADPEMEEGRFSYIAENDVHRRWFGADGMRRVAALLNREGGRMRGQFLSTAAGLGKPGDEEGFYAFTRGNCVHVHVSFVALNSRTGACAYLVSHTPVTNLSGPHDPGALREYLRGALGEIADLDEGL